MTIPAFLGSRLSRKVAALGAGAAMVAALAMATIALRQSGEYEALAMHEIGVLLGDELDQVTSAAYKLVRAEDEAIRQELGGALNLARRALSAPGIAAGLERGEFRAGELGRVVAEVTAIVGSAATVFRRTNEAGDMVRVATTVRDASGHAAIGTALRASEPGGSPNPVIAAILRGEPYRGRAFVVDSWYISAYEPLRSASGRVIGMLFVGIPQARAESRIREAIVSTRLGKTGYLYVVTGKGENRGRYVVSKGGERDGENIWDLRDADGNYITRANIEAGIALGPGELGTIRYRWQNPGEPEPRWRIARIAYYAPWDWLIGLSVYEDEVESYRGIIAAGRLKMARDMYYAGLAVALLVAAAAWSIAQGIAGPLKRMAAAAELVANGGADLVAARGRDEVGTLAEAFNVMSRRVEETMAGLRASEESFRGIFENAAEGIIRTTMEGGCLEANPAMARMLGYGSAEEFVAAHQDMRGSFYADGGDRELLLGLLRERGVALGLEIRARRGDGSAIWVSLNARLEPAPPGGQRRILSLVSDIDRRRRADEALKASLKEKNLLLQEIHHRVKNNLQVIASLISMQSRIVSDPASLALYQDFSNRVLAMSQIHDKVYGSEDFSRVDFGGYARDLAASLRQSFAESSGGAAVEVSAGQVDLELNQAVTCGLLVNEILSNSFRHAFPPDRRPAGGRIRVRIKAGPGSLVELELSDDGVGIPEGIGPGDTEHLGLALIPMLAAQLGASLALDREGGTRYRIAFARA